MTNNHPLSPPGVTILGQPEPIPYPLGGHVLGFTMPPDEVAQLHRETLARGLQPDVGFVLLWQRTAMELAVLTAKNEDLHERLEKLEAQLGCAPGSVAAELQASHDRIAAEGSTNDGK